MPTKAIQNSCCSLVFYFSLRGQVLILKSVYNGQNDISEVSKNTTANTISTIPAVPSIFPEK
jgi:hypothetical protein